MRIRPPGLAAIYARVSTEGQATLDATSLPRQVKVCRRAAEKLLGFTVAEDYVIEEAYSASNPDDRPGLDRLYAGAAQKRFQYALMDVIDRTTRAGPGDLHDICKRLKSYDVEPVWAGHPDIDMTTKDGPIEAARLAIKAYEDAQTIFRRFQSGKMERIEEKQLIRSHIEYGYRWNAPRPLVGDEDMRTMWLPDESGDPSPAEVVRRIYTTLAQAWRTGGDASAKQMALTLRRANILTSSAHKGRSHGDVQWQHAMIIYIVTNPSYKGQHPQNRWKKEPYTDEEKAKHLARTGRPYKNSYKHVERPESEWVYVEVPALVDEQTWEDANKQLQKNRETTHRDHVRYTTDDALLWGTHVRCAECGYAMQVWRENEHHPWKYVCRQDGPAKAHPRRPNRISVRLVDRFVWSEATRIIRDPEYLRSRLEQGKQEFSSPEQDIERYTELIAECDADDMRLADDLAEARRRDTSESFRKRILDDSEANNAKRKGFEDKLKAAQAAKRALDQEAERLAAFAAKARAQAPTFDDLNAEQRRQLLLDLHAEVHVARLDNDKKPRVFLIFSLTPDAATRVRNDGLWATSTLQTPQGDFVTYVEPSWGAAQFPLDKNGERAFDFSVAPDGVPLTTSTLPSSTSHVLHGLVEGEQLAAVLGGVCGEVMLDLGIQRRLDGESECDGIEIV